MAIIMSGEGRPEREGTFSKKGSADYYAQKVQAILEFYGERKLGNELAEEIKEFLNFDVKVNDPHFVYQGLARINKLLLQKGIDPIDFSADDQRYQKYK